MLLCSTHAQDIYIQFKNNKVSLKDILSGLLNKIGMATFTHKLTQCGYHFHVSIIISLYFEVKVVEEFSF